YRRGLRRAFVAPTCQIPSRLQRSQTPVAPACQIPSRLQRSRTLVAPWLHTPPCTGGRPWPPLLPPREEPNVRGHARPTLSRLQRKRMFVATCGPTSSRLQRSRTFVAPAVPRSLLGSGQWVSNCLLSG